MFSMAHEDAIELEHQVCRLFKNNVSGLNHADIFEDYPMNAAVMIISYICATESPSANKQREYNDFWSKYDTIFTYPEENDASGKVQDYICELTKIVDEHIGFRLKIR